MANPTPHPWSWYLSGPGAMLGWNPYSAGPPPAHGARRRIVTPARPRAQLQPQEQTKLDQEKAKLQAARPASGRTSALGRKVEKPGTGNPGGPSGQTDEAKHDRKHANK
jgi:hypothetical protein